MGFARYYRVGKFLKHNKLSWLKEGGTYPDDYKLKASLKFWGENLGSAGASELG